MMCYVYTAIYEGIKTARDLVNMPPNELTPRKFSDIAAALCKSENITVETLNKWQLEKLKMGGLLAVGKGSMNNPQMVTVTYTGNTESRDKLAVVGKGITYDSGGLSLKDHDDRRWCGAAVSRSLYSSGWEQGRCLVASSKSQGTVAAV